MKTVIVTIMQIILWSAVANAAVVLRVSSIECDRGRCVRCEWSGVCIAADRDYSYVATAAHPFRTPQRSISVEGRPAVLVGKTLSNGIDVALLRVAGKPFDADELHGTIAVGQSIRAAGYAGGRLQDLRGTVIQAGVMTPRSSAGMSGGPVTVRGEVAGLIYGDDGRYGRYTPIRYAQAILDNVLRDDVPSPPAPKVPESSLTKRIEAVERQSRELAATVTELQRTVSQLGASIESRLTAVDHRQPADQPADLTAILARLKTLEGRMIRVVVAHDGKVVDDDTYAGHGADPIVLDLLSTKK